MIYCRGPMTAYNLQGNLPNRDLSIISPVF
jgi:hypothetical protein